MHDSHVAGAYGVFTWVVDSVPILQTPIPLTGAYVNRAWNAPPGVDVTATVPNASLQSSHVFALSRMPED